MNIGNSIRDFFTARIFMMTSKSDLDVFLPALNSNDLMQKVMTDSKTKMLKREENIFIMDKKMH
jgi:hypothetical protein